MCWRRPHQYPKLLRLWSIWKQLLIEQACVSQKHYSARSANSQNWRKHFLGSSSMLSLDYIVQTKSKGYLERSLRSFNLWTICISWIDTPAKGHRSYFQSLQTLQIPNINAMLDVFIPYRNECSAVLCLIQIQQSVTIGVQNLISAVLSLRRKRSSSFSGTPSSSYLRLDTYVRSHIYVWTESGIIDPLVSKQPGTKFDIKNSNKYNKFKTNK